MAGGNRPWSANASQRRQVARVAAAPVSDSRLSRHHAQHALRVPSSRLGSGVSRSPRDAKSSIRGRWTNRSFFSSTGTHARGVITYSEGCNDDVNKAIWSRLCWDPDAQPIDTLREYSRYFIGDEYTDDFAQGLLALERNWRGPLLDQ